MKSFRFTSLKSLAVLIGGMLLVSPATQAGDGGVSHRSNGGTARLQVRRAADFGTEIFLNLFIDGVQVTMMPINTGYEALLRPGTHVLAISTTPCPYGKTRYTYRTVRMEPGQTYLYTAVWEYADVAQLGSSERVAELMQNRTWY